MLIIELSVFNVGRILQVEGLVGETEKNFDVDSSRNGKPVKIKEDM